MIKRFAAAGILALAAMSAHAQDQIPVVASFSILGDLVSQVGGDKVAVTTLVGPNGDAHEFQPTPQDVAKVTDARVLVLNGLGLEGWMTRLSKAASANPRRVTIVASDSVAPAMRIAGQHDGHPHQAIDPHAWQDPQRVEIYIRNIAAGLEQADPSHAGYYAARAADYTAKLKALDEWIAQSVGSVEPAKRRLITSHTAFGYFSSRYGVEMIGLNGVDTSAEAGAQDIAQIVRVIRAQRIKALFVENIANPRLMQQVARETGAMLGDKLYSDSLSEAGGPAADYLALMRHNVTAMVAGMRRN